MNENDDIQLRLANRMDEAFCARMIAAVGVVTTPGTKKPKYVPAAQPPRPLVSSLIDMDV